MLRSLPLVVVLSCASSRPARLQGPVLWSPAVRNPVVLGVGDVLEVSYFKTYQSDKTYRLDVGDLIRVDVGAGHAAGLYRLRAGDEIRLIIRSNVEQGPYQILPDGRSTLPMVGPVSLAGKTVEEATADLKRLYSRYYQNPPVTILVTASTQPDISAQCTVLPDGTCTLPVIGSVTLRGLTADEAAQRLTPLYVERIPQVSAQVIVVQSRGSIEDFFKILLSGSRGATRDVTVTEEGAIDLPLIPPIPALGQTLESVRARIQSAYASALAGVDVQVTIGRGARQVAVMGAVIRGGVFDAPYPISPLTAISLAGGFTPKARRSQVLVVHPETDGSVLTREVNLDEVLDADDLSPLAVAVYPHDLVFVPTSRIANVNAFVEQYIRNMLPVDVGAGFGWNLAK